MNKLTKSGWWIVLGGVVFALLPILALLIAFALTSLTGCEVNEGYAEPCSVLGLDISELLYTLFVSGWFALMTVPLGFVIVVFGLVMVVVGFIKQLMNRVK